MGLVETVLCVLLLSLMFLGAMDLIMSAGRTTVRTQSQVYANADAANALQAVIIQLRDASGFALPTSAAANQTETDWTPLNGVNTALFSTVSTLGGAAETINTAIEIVSPTSLTPAQNGYTTLVPQPNGGMGLPAGIRVVSQAGGPNGYWEANSGSWTVGTPTNAQIAGSLASGVVLIYRGDPDGTPDADPTNPPNAKPKAGTYLWQYSVPSDSTFNLAAHAKNMKVLCKSVAPVSNAVQFVRPVYGAVVEKDQVEVKIISSYYSPTNGRQTTEEGDGTTTSQLTGKCVYMHNHCTAGEPGNPNAQHSNNAFQNH